MFRFDLRSMEKSLNTCRNLTVSLLQLFLLSGFVAGIASAQEKAESSKGLIAYYDFGSDSGEMVRDRSGIDPPMHLKIEKLSNVRRAVGQLKIIEPTKVEATRGEAKLLKSIQESNAFSVVVWCEPANDTQNGPSRIVSFSKNSVERNFTIGQEKKNFDVRFRTTKTSTNGLPSTSAEGIKTEPTQLVYSREKNGNVKLFIDGRLTKENKVEGEISNWLSDASFLLGNEKTGDRAWLGTFYSVAIFNRVLSKQEIEKDFSTSFKKLKKRERAHKPYIAAEVSSVTTGSSPRSRDGLLAFYDFASEKGDIVFDRSGVGAPLNLKISNPKNVRRTRGAMQVNEKVSIKSLSAATKITRNLRRTNAISIEAWIQSQNTKQAGPARIVTMSIDSQRRNVTLGQDGNKFDVRLRTTRVSENGIPSTSSKSGSVSTKLTHVVYTRSKSGKTTIFVDGKESSSGKIDGDFSNWDDSFSLALGDEFTGGRLWKGTYRMLAFYNRALSVREIENHFSLGPKSEGLEMSKNQRAHLFETRIAPILSKHCLECHDAANSQGGLDLSMKKLAFAGGENGPAIVAKKLGESLAWAQIKSDEMPLDRDPLSSDEKRLIKTWIESGAEWTLDLIDPAVYVHEGREYDNWVQRLTVSEYVNTINAIFGIDISQDAKKLLPPDMRADGFSNTAYNLNVDLKHVESYNKLASLIVARSNIAAMIDRHSKQKSFDPKVVHRFVSSLGEEILRGSLDENEIVAFQKIFAIIERSEGTFDEAAGYCIEAMLQSPRFIYRMEVQYADGSAWRVSQNELANRISYIIIGSSPDAELRKLASQNKLRDKQLIGQIDRLLSDTRAVERSKEFVSQWLNLSRLENLQPNAKSFPKWNRQLGIDMKRETLEFFEEVAWRQKRPLGELFDSQFTFATKRLAKYYNFPSSKLEKIKDENKLVRFDLKETSERGGLLTHGSILTIGGDEASMVARGLFVMHDILRGVVKDPPPCVDTTPVPTKSGLSQRSIAMQRIANNNCGGCHGKFEPLAFALEKYDGTGAFHQKDHHGNALREDGKIVIPALGTVADYKTTSELSRFLAKSPRVYQTMTWKLTQFSLGRPLLASDAREVDKIFETSQNNGGTYQSLLRAIVLSDLVQFSRTKIDR